MNPQAQRSLKQAKQSTQRFKSVLKKTIPQDSEFEALVARFEQEDRLVLQENLNRKEEWL